jgi:hypothetical protein
MRLSLATRTVAVGGPPRGTRVPGGRRAWRARRPIEPAERDRRRRARPMCVPARRVLRVQSRTRRSHTVRLTYAMSISSCAVLMRVYGHVQGDNAPDPHEIGCGRARGAHEPRARGRTYQGGRAGLVGSTVPDSGPAGARPGIHADVRRRDGDMVRLGFR